MLYYETTLQIEPKAKGRPRFTVRGKYARVYTDAKTLKNQEQLRTLLRASYKNDPCKEWCFIELVFHLPLPDSVKRQHPTVKPDLDNLIKQVLDSANGILFTDDKIILEIKASKKYSGVGAISIKLRGE